MFVKYNFFTRTLKEWNSLPPFLLDQISVEAFKSALTNYFNLCYFFNLYIISFYYLSIIIIYFVVFFVFAFVFFFALCEL